MAAEPEEPPRGDGGAEMTRRRTPARWRKGRITAETGFLIWRTLLMVWMTVEAWPHRSPLSDGRERAQGVRALGLPRGQDRSGSVGTPWLAGQDRFPSGRPGADPRVA
jgi:hypothetical protein